MASERKTPPKPSSVAGGKYQVEKKLGAGCFAEVYRGRNTETAETVAVKVESIQIDAPQLEHEAETLRLLASPSLPQGVPAVHFFGHAEPPCRVLVLDLLGRSLEDRVQWCQGRFDAQTTILVAEQVIRRIEYLHSKGIIHRDIKPENFMFGCHSKIHHIYLIDLGLSKRYWDDTKCKHVSIRNNLRFTGTARYAAISSHRGVEQSRRSDLEAVGYMLLYFLRGSLPWSGLDAKTQEEKYRKILDKKQEVPLSELCQGHPPVFMEYLDYARNLSFAGRPDYEFLKSRFRSARAELEQVSGAAIRDHDFKWLRGKDLSDLTPLDDDAPPQPDAAIVKAEARSGRRTMRYGLAGIGRALALVLPCALCS